MFTANNRAENQHSVPRFLLRNFRIGEEGLLHVFDKLFERKYDKSIRKVVTENGFYDFEHAGEHQTLEPFLGKLESAASRVISSIIRRESIKHLTTSDRVVMSLFAAVQLLRVKRYRQRFQSLNTGLRNELANRGIDPGDVLPQMEEDDVKRESIRHIELAKNEFTKYFYEKVWILQEAPSDKPFYISDNPVTFHHFDEQHAPGNVGLMTPGVEIYLPISKQFSICFLCRSWEQAIHHGLKDAASIKRRLGLCPHDVTLLHHLAQTIETGEPDPLLAANVTHQNSLQVLFSSRFVFSANGDFELAESMVRNNPQLKSPPTIIVH